MKTVTSPVSKYEERSENLKNRGDLGLLGSLKVVKMSQFDRSHPAS